MNESNPPPTTGSGAWSSGSPGTAVSSGQTSAFGLPVLKADGTPASSGPHPSPTKSAGPRPDALAALAGLDENNAVTEAAAAGADGSRASDGSLVGSITGFFKRCKNWMSESDKPAPELPPNRAGLRVVIDPTPSAGVISLQRADRVGTTAAPIGNPRRDIERQVRDQAREPSVIPSDDAPAVGDARRRILEKQQAMLDMRRQRELEDQETAAKEPPPKLFRRPPGDELPGA